MNKHPPPDSVFVKAGLFFFSEKQASSIQAYYTEDIKNGQVLAIWNDELFFIANIKGVVSSMKDYFKGIFGDQPKSFGHAFSNENSPETIAFKKALDENKVKVTDSVQCNKCIVDRISLKAINQEWVNGYFGMGQVKHKENV